jgi:hypothetical protein
MAADDPDGGRLPCPCCARRAERPLMAVHRRILLALAVAGLTAMAVLGTSSAPVRAQPTASPVSLPPGGGGGPAGRITLIVIAVVAAAAFAALQVIARSQRRRWSAYADWRTWPPGYDPWADGSDPVAGRHEGSAYRPGYGFLPGHGRGLLPRDLARLRCLGQDVASVMRNRQVQVSGEQPQRVLCITRTFT